MKYKLIWERNVDLKSFFMDISYQSNKRILGGRDYPKAEKIDATVKDSRPYFHM